MVIGAVLVSRVSSGQNADNERLPPHVQAIVEVARGAAAEFRSDALIRLSGSSAVPRVARKLLLEEAFAIAANAQEPVKRESAIASVDTRAATMSRGFDLDLDRLSLQSRAAEAMLAVDPAAARDLFTQLHPSVVPLRCEDALIYQFTDFYLRAGTILGKAFTTQARVEQEHTRFLEQYVGDVTSPAQVAGMAELLRRAVLSTSELGRVTMTFAWALEQIGGDSRSFFQATGAPASVVRLIEHVRNRGVAPERLIDALRTYLVRNLSGERCESSDVNQRYWIRMVEDFNAAVRVMGASEVPRITDAEIASSHSGGGAPSSHPYWQSAETKALLDAERQLATTVPVLDYLDAVNRWTGDAEQSDHDYFHQKAALFTRLLRFGMSSADRQRVFTDAVHFLASYDVERDSRLAWAVRVEDIIRAANQWNTHERDAAFTAIDRFGDGSMKLRAMLDALADDRTSRER
jgi:hypothetical protein